MKLLCAADLHLGRQASRLPADLSDQRSNLTPAEAWRRLVRLAVEDRVTAVLLAGDVLEDEHDYFEAFGDLRAGAAELVAAGIAVLAVAGNHDVEVLPRLAAAVPGVRLLGAGGVWEAATLDDGTTRVNVVGWSWPSLTVTASPVAEVGALLHDLEPAFTIGLLHCDLDQTHSRYAPVRSLELSSAGLDAWLLGHVHRPTFAASADGDRWSGYLGSTFAADPGEEGPRGAWLLDVSEGVAGRMSASVEQVALSPLRFETLSVDVSALDDKDDVRLALTEALEGHHAGADVTGGRFPPVAVGLRLRIVGRSALRGEIAEALRKDDPRDLSDVRDGVSYFVHDVSLEVYPPLDVEALARGRDPAGLLARRLTLLDGPPSSDRTALLDAGREAMLQAAGSRHYRGLEEPELSDELVVATLRRAALALLDEMAP